MSGELGTDLSVKAWGKKDGVSRLGLGCWQFSNGRGLVGRFWPSMTDDAVRSVLAASFHHGVTWCDTAEAYGNGASEEVLGHLMPEFQKPEQALKIATKWNPFMRTAGNMLSAVDNQRNRLKAPIDLYQIHMPTSVSSIPRQATILCKLLSQGKIARAGVSNFSAKQMRVCAETMAKQGFHLVSNQVKYSLVDRRIESNGVFAAAQELGIRIIAYSPLEQGLLTGKFHRDRSLFDQLPYLRRYGGSFRKAMIKRTAPVIETLESAARAEGATPAQMALAWLMRFNGPNVTVVAGAQTPQQAAENAEALQLNPKPEVLAALDQVSRKRGRL